ncbi:MAG: NDP-sugar synthase, partial [Clostridia bacterium]|nr:NDP-sugar synthase [Clostridia bacterium]
MKAIIMAGGEGTRLRPLTCDLPKPMAPLMDRPVMACALELLKRHGIVEVGSTLMYLPERVQSYFEDGAAFGVSMRYFVEKAPLGTAGSMHLAADFLDETFVVLSGDGVTDCDLTQAVRFHREKKALATLVLKHVENPLEYGVVITDASGRVTRFVEKPGWGEVFSDTVNTGIYILEPQVLGLIPKDKAFDFGRDLFPQMAARGEAVYAWTMSGYWCDIGDVAAYLRAHADAMDGRINLPLNVRPAGVIRMPGARVEPGAVLEGPCFIGEGAVIRSGARVGAYSVVGAGCVVESGASLKRAVLWKGARVGAGAQARCCVLMDGARMEPDSAAFEESVLGSGATLGAGASLMPGVRVWPRKRIEAGARLDANVVWGSTERASFEGGCLRFGSPDGAARAGSAAASALGSKSALVGRA